MTDDVAPRGVKILNAKNVRLGTCLAPGNVVLGPAFRDTGAETLGPAAVEGRISLGAFVGTGLGRSQSPAASMTDGPPVPGSSDTAERSFR